MNEEKQLRAKARQAIEAGHLPDRAPDQIWGGPGTGARCAICHAAVHHGEVELEIEYVRHDCPRPTTFHVHLRCFSALESERRFFHGTSRPEAVEIFPMEG